MNPSRLASLVVFTVVLLFFGAPQLRADDTPPSLDDVHKVLLQAAGDSADSPPPVDQQKELLGQALEMIHKLPHVYHGELRHAAQDVEAALVELGNGDGAHKARHDILDADDLIKSIM
jgi:hypothetical protein